MRLATWNILHGKSLDDDRVDAARLRAAVADLDVDVLGVQEVDRGQARLGGLDLAAEVAAGLGAREWRFLPALTGAADGPWRVAAGADGVPGAAYGSRWSRGTRFEPGTCCGWALPAPPTGSRVPWLRDEARVALAAVVVTPLGVMTVASTHLSVVRGWSAVQLCRLSRWLRELPEPQIVLGDLKMSARAAGVASGFQVLARHATHPSHAPRVQLDHVLGRGVLPPVRASGAPCVPLSDHRPLVVELSRRAIRAFVCAKGSRRGRVASGLGSEPR
ncbi:MAG: endonuclease/exonuclease/phosphatase family protein [Actinomycetota bacterium]|nr:endonuclease/exonuclease/phosphatase family protein [Actinomycetota bacterium]